jgi:predicted DNA binding CopG/RHH family protein
MKKPPLPRFDSDEAARQFVAEADLTAFDLTGGTVVRYEFQPKTADVHLRMPKPLLDAVKAEAVRAGVPYQRFIRQTLEEALETARRRA